MLRCSMRVEIWHGDEIDVALTANEAAFKTAPAAGDYFIPGSLGPALQRLGIRPRVAFIEHWPTITGGEVIFRLSGKIVPRIPRSASWSRDSVVHRPVRWLAALSGAVEPPPSGTRRAPEHENAPAGAFPGRGHPPEGSYFTLSPAD